MKEFQYLPTEDQGQLEKSSKCKLEYVVYRISLPVQPCSKSAILIKF